MWVKVFADGTVIKEDRNQGLTWLKTPTEGLVEVYMLQGRLKSPSIKACSKFWHSRTGICREGQGTMQVIKERIQGLLDDGRWYTVEWDNESYSVYYTSKAIGMPIRR